jgi:hypothetical protein
MNDLAVSTDVIVAVAVVPVPEKVIVPRCMLLMIDVA